MDRPTASTGPSHFCHDLPFRLFVVWAAREDIGVRGCIEWIYPAICIGHDVICRLLAAWTIQGKTSALVVDGRLAGGCGHLLDGYSDDSVHHWLSFSAEQVFHVFAGEFLDER